MNIYYSPFFTKHQFVSMPDGHVMMDCTIADTEQLVSLLELHLGIHTESRKDLERVIEYYRLLRNYIDSHPQCVLADSFRLAGLSVARTCLQWRDELTLFGWSSSCDAPTERLQILKSIEPDFAPTDKNLSARFTLVEEALATQPDVLSGSTIHLMVPRRTLPPRMQKLLSLLKNVTIEDAPEWSMPALTPDHLHVWNFQNEQEAFRYMASLEKGAYDVWINADNKLMDNWLHMSGQPTSGSIVEADNNLVLQLLPLGIRLFQAPVNIKSLIDYLMLPVNPLEGALRYRLSNTIGERCGFYNKECDSVVKKYIDGEYDCHVEDKEERQKRVDTYLPCMEKQTEGKEVNMHALQKYLASMQSWANQRASLLREKHEDEKLEQQLFQLAYLIEVLMMLLKDHNDSSILYDEVELLVTGLYEVSSSVQYYAEAGCQEVVQTPADILTDAKRILWFNPSVSDNRKLSLHWLTTVERKALEKDMLIWSQDDERKAYYHTLLGVLNHAQKEITIITTETYQGEDTPASSLILRMKSGNEQWEEQFVTCPQIDESKIVPVEKIENVEDGPYIEIKNTELMAARMREKESASSLASLIEHPRDYAFTYLANISPLGSAVLPDQNTTEGTTAHAIIAKLFEPREGENLDAMAKRVEAEYEQVFDEQVQAYGAMLLMPENILEQSYFHDRLLLCIKNLAEILVENRLHVTHCELEMNDHLRFLEGEKDIFIDGFIDFTLEDEAGNPVIFDFKWTRSKHHYQDLLRDNKSLQLALYAALLSKETSKDVQRTAYFLMPQGRLFSTSVFEGDHYSKIDTDDTSDLLPRIINSYRFRREELMNGRIESTENMATADFDYINSMEEQNLYPLPMTDNVKDPNPFTNFAFLFS